MKDKRSLSVVGLCFVLMVGLSWEVGAFSESNFEKLKATESCMFCDLLGTDLSDATLIEVDLAQENLIGENLTGTIFCETKMPDGTKTTQIIINETII